MIITTFSTIQTPLLLSEMKKKKRLTTTEPLKKTNFLKGSGKLLVF